MRQLLRTSIAILLVAAATACASMRQPATEAPCTGERMIRVSNPSSIPLELVSGRGSRVMGVVEPRASLTLPDDGGGFWLSIPQGVQRSLARPGEVWIWDSNRRQQLIQRYCAT